MSYFARFSPIRAYRDLRLFLLQRQPHELWFLLLALVLTSLLLAGFTKDSKVAPVYKRDIIYVDQWRLDRTDAEIIAKQKIDQVARAKQLAEIKRREAESRAQFKRLDDKLTRYGF